MSGQIPPVLAGTSILQRPFRPEDLPLLGPSIRHWRLLVLAHTAARREAKALLFSELAEATRHGMPLSLALAMNSQTLRESRDGRPSENQPGADSAHRRFDLLVALLMFLVCQIALVIYMLVAFRATDVVRIARLLGLRLHVHVSKGLPLAEAMKRCGTDYDDQEIRLAQAGEAWGALPQTLRRLAEFQVTEASLTAQGAQMLYPLWLAAFLAPVASFVAVVILPKFVDIYRQLGAELPRATQMLIDASFFFVRGPGVPLLGLIGMAAFFFLFRALMNGSRLAKFILLLPFVVLLGLAIGVTFSLGRDFLGGSLRQQPWLAAFLFAGLLALGFAGFVLLVPRLLETVERVVLGVERLFSPVVRFLPLVGNTARVQLQARWLSAVAVALESGVEPHQAVHSAGIVCGGGMEERSRRAAGRISAGQSIGEACLEDKVLSPAANHRLILLDSSAEYVAGMRALADDMAQEAYNQLNRAARVAQVVTVCLLGLVVGAFTIAMYLPLFNIPRIVGE